MDRRNTQRYEAGRPHGRPHFRSQNLPQGRAQDRPQDRPHDRPKDLPQGRAQDRPQDRPHDRPKDLPQGRAQDRPQGRPHDRPKDLPQNLPQDRAQNRPHDRPQKSLQNQQTSKAAVGSPSTDDMDMDCQTKVTQLSKQNFDLLQSNEAWKAKCTALEDKFTKSLLRAQECDELQIEYMTKMDLVEDQIHQKDKELFDLRQQKEDLSLTLKKTQNQLSNKNIELVQSNEVWKAKYSALEKDFADNLHLKEQSLETLQVEHQKNVNLLETEIHHLSEQLAESQSQLLSERAEVHQSIKTWQEKYDALEEKTARDLDLKDKNLEALQVEHQVNLDKLETNIHRLEQFVESHSQLLSERAEVHQSIEAWQEKYDTLEKKTSKDLDLKDKNLEALQAEHQVNLEQLETKIHRLSEQLAESQSQLLSERALEQKTSKDQDLKDKSSESRINALLSDRKTLDEKLKEELLKTERLELEKKVLAQLHQSQETEVQQLKDERKILEDVCLQMKRKSRGYFGKKMEDRVTELEKMKRKMQAEELKKKERQEKAQKQKTATGFFSRTQNKKTRDGETKLEDVDSAAEVVDQ